MAVSDEETKMKFENQKHFSAWYRRTPAGRKYAYASGRASEADRLWFEAHPGVNVYVRPMVEGEFPPSPHRPPIIGVCVEQVHRDFRIRRALFMRER